MMFYFYIWLLVGFVSGMIGFCIDYRKGIDITVSDVGRMVWFSVMGPVTTAFLIHYFITEYSDIVIMKGKKK
jgi:hypothetical protein